MVAARTSSHDRSQRASALGLRLLLLAFLSILILVVDHRENHLDAVRRGLQSPREVADYTELNYDSVRHLMVHLAADGKLTRVATGRYAVRGPGLMS